MCLCQFKVIFVTLGFLLLLVSLFMSLLCQHGVSSALNICAVIVMLFSQ